MAFPNDASVPVCITVFDFLLISVDVTHVGMNKESKEFAGKLFDALARKLDIKEDSITKEQLNEFWAQISEQGFDSRLQTFFDM